MLGSLSTAGPRTNVAAHVIGFLSGLLLGTLGDRFAFAAGAQFLLGTDALAAADMTETARLTPSDLASNDRFGVAVSASTTRVLVGARWSDAAADNAGAAYIFERPEGGWTEAGESARLLASDAAASDEFGVSVALQGDIAAIGAYLADDANADDVGCVGLWFPEGWPELELGYWLMREMQGKGYATCEYDSAVDVMWIPS